MADQERAIQLGNRGFDLWGKGQLLEAADCFREALSLTEPGHYRLVMYHGSLAGVLSALDRDDEALAEYVKALAIDLELDGDDASASVAVSRYFLAEHLLKLHREEEALNCIAPSLSAAAKPEAILRMVETECLARLGRTGEAIEAAKRSVETAATQDQRERIRERLKSILPLAGTTDNGEGS